MTLKTNATAGMTVKLLKNLIWPKQWNYPGTCALSTNLCTTDEGGTIKVKADFPCDQKATSVVEGCIQPEAVIQGTNLISSCPGTSVKLDASRSTGSGIKPLTFTWSANPTKTDNYITVQSVLVASGSSSVVTLPGSSNGKSVLDGGKTFAFLLV